MENNLTLDERMMIFCYTALALSQGWYQSAMKFSGV